MRRDEAAISVHCLFHPLSASPPTLPHNNKTEKAKKKGNKKRGENSRPKSPETSSTPLGSPGAEGEVEAMAEGGKKPGVKGFFNANVRK